MVPHGRDNGLRGLRLGMTHFRLLLHYLTELGEQADQCLALTGVREDQLDDPDTEIAAEQEIALIRLLIRRYGAAVEHGLAVGLRQRLTAYGPWGMGLMSSSSVAVAAEWAGRFSILAFPFVRYDWQQGDRGPLLVLDYDHMPEDTRSFLLARDLAAIHAIHQDLVPDLPPGISEIRLPYRALEGAEKLSQLFGCPLFMNQPCVALYVDPDVMSESLSRGNELTVTQCGRLCLELMERRRAEPMVSQHVRRLLDSRDGVLLTVADVAMQLHRSERNLRRQLQREGTGWRQLREEALVRRARQLLDGGRHSIDQVADRLGYTDRSSFCHAFKRWTGISPVRYRNSGAAARDK